MTNKAKVEHTYKNVWDKLNKIDLSSQTKKKMNLTYLSWTWAWGVLMENYPEATYNFYQAEDGTPFCRYPNGTAEVRCRIQIGELQREMSLAVMDNKNNSIAEPSSTDVNNAKMRCLVKCLAMYGLGHYIYAGEDLPQDAKAEIKPKAESKPKAEPKTEPEEHDEGWANSIIEALKIAIASNETKDGLNSVFKGNKPYIDVIEEKHPAKYKELLGLFTVKKEEIQNG
tara:strand:- start:1323 stop:2003 length:681 start_codon:yes stop_codon:yes gene_type:complete